MIILESIQKLSDDSFVLIIWRLPYLEDMTVCRQLWSVDRERDNQLDIMTIYKERHRFHLFGVKRAEDDITVLGFFLIHDLMDITIFRSIPCVNINRDTQRLQTVTSHQDTTIILHHTLAIAIDIMKGQHHPKTDGTLGQII